ncbi:MAG: hypothetical protein GQ532_14035 [Methylomarinum sp.]|nr:hypothetical protein [Methylomarinum sp.]
MKTKKLIKKAQQLLDFGHNEQYDQIVSLKELLKELKRKKILLKEKLDKEQDIKKVKSIKRKLEVIKAQRKKGLNLIKKLKKIILANH